MIEKFKVHSRLSLLSIAAMVVACESYKEAPLVYDPNEQAGAAPVINSVEPAGAAFAGYTEVRLLGANFSPQVSANTVYFATEPGQITGATPTEIRVIPPNLLGDNLTIKVVVNNALQIAQFSPYSLKAVSVEYGNFTDLDLVYALAVDVNENLYAHNRRQGASISNVEKITPSAKSIFGSTSFPQAIEMHMGPGGELYLHRSLGNLFRMGAGGGDAQAFATTPQRTASFDFDENGNIFAAGNRSGMYVINAAGAVAGTGRFLAFDVRSVRVFSGFVYVAALYTGTDPAFPRSGIWRAQILSTTGALGSEEAVFDWANAGVYAAARFFAITFSQDGEIFVGTNHADPILRIKTDGATEPLYPGLLKPDATHIVWGNGDHLYMNRGSTQASNRRVYRIDMGKKGAPYYGRK